MLLELRLGNFALAADVTFALGPGLTALTGETGAGKSMIAGSLALLGGGRGDRDLIRAGEDLAWVEGVFDLGARADLRSMCARLGLPLADDAILVVRREIRREGRSRVLINGLVSSVAVLERLGPQILAVQSQDQQRELAEPSFARDLLDELLGLDEPRRHAAESLNALREARRALRQRQEESALARQQIEFWRHQHDELTEAGLREGEEAELVESIAVKRHAHALQQSAQAALERLEDGPAPARESLGAAESVLTPHAGHSPRLAAALAAVAAAAEQTAEAVQTLNRFLDQLDLDPRGLDELEQRKAIYEDLRRKYRRDVSGLIELRGELDGQLARQEAATSDLEELEDRQLEAQRQFASAAAELRARRGNGAPKVAARALAVIRPLALPDLQLEFTVAAAANPESEDRVDLLVRTNPGESRGPVAAVASGGERSRIHLGLTVLRQGESGGPALRVFDEVDAGLGMDAAAPVGQLLRRLAAHGQVLCITHLPTLAVHAQDHLVVTKRVQGGRTTLQVQPLDGDQRVREIARLLGGAGYGGGDQTAQIAYARELLQAGEAAAAGA